jgi:hypothetical protein
MRSGWAGGPHARTQGWQAPKLGLQKISPADPLQQQENRASERGRRAETRLLRNAHTLGLQHTDRDACLEALTDQDQPDAAHDPDRPFNARIR